MPFDCRLYLLTPPVLPTPDALAAALDAGDVAALQLRLPGADDDTLRRAIDQVRPIAQARGVALILNNAPALALETGCDGCHLEGGTITPAEARALLGRNLQIGVSCGDSRDTGMQAGEAGADYISFGGFFPSTTKEITTYADVELVRWWAEIMEIPVVAVGGIDATNCADLVRAGANFLAVAGAVWSHPNGPAAGVRAMNAAIAEA